MKMDDDLEFDLEEIETLHSLAMAANDRLEQSVTVPMDQLLSVIDLARKGAMRGQEHRRVLQEAADVRGPDPELTGSGPYLCVKQCPYTGRYSLALHKSMRGVIADGSDPLGAQSWQFEIKRELTWDQLFTESNFGFAEWFGSGEQRPDPTDVSENETGAQLQTA